MNRPRSHLGREVVGLKVCGAGYVSHERRHELRVPQGRCVHRLEAIALALAVAAATLAPAAAGAAQGGLSGATGGQKGPVLPLVHLWGSPTVHGDDGCVNEGGKHGTGGSRAQETRKETKGGGGGGQPPKTGP